MSIETVAVSKAVVTGGVGATLLLAISDPEFVILTFTGIFSACMSYFYDWVHRDPKYFRLKEFAELLKHIFYGVAVIFVIFYLLAHHIDEYLNLPNTAWGAISALASASAVGIVEWFTPIAGEAVKKIVGGVK